ncbi:MAG TPA: acyltransferase [Blastocatellia bacterium]|nr:acyltransferase [Blastocatellia bacterium]
MPLPENLESKLIHSHIPALDGLRAVAVFLVIIGHFGFVMVPGGHGVMIFFVLSGFLITWLLLKENERTGKISLGAFYKRRTLRIFPAFYAYWLMMVTLLVATGRAVLWPHAWSALLYTSNYYSAINGDPNNGFSHTWSLAIEEQFYLLWPFLFLMLRGNLRRMTIFLAGLIGAVWIHRAILCYEFRIDQAYIYAAFDTRLDELMVGCLLAVLLKRGSLANVWRTISSNVLLPVVTIALLAISIYAGEAYIDRYRDVFGFAIEPLLFAILIVQMIALSSTRTWSWTEWRTIKFLGRISYSLYLYQQLTLHAVRHALEAYPVVVQLSAAIAVTIVLATISHYLIERPFLKLKSDSPRPRKSLVYEMAAE